MLFKKYTAFEINLSVTEYIFTVFQHQCYIHIQYRNYLRVTLDKHL